jgi:hypothetical protein
MFKKILAAAGSAVAVAGLAVFGAGGSAYAGPAAVTAVTHISNAPDSGNGGTWAYDDYTRTLTVSVDPSQAGASAGDTLYLASVTDHGEFHAISGADAPNQVVAGVKVSHAVTGAFNGGATYVVSAPSSDTLTGSVVADLNDHFAAAAGDKTTTSWPVQAFGSASGVTLAYTDSGNGWSWNYKTACESWTDAGTNGYGDLAGDGNITGKACTVAFTSAPQLYDGQAQWVAATRENVEFKITQSEPGPQWVKFVIHGPGPINGHEGWVPAYGDGTLNQGVYGGLNGNAGYTVDYYPVTGQGSNHLVPGSHLGYVWFTTSNTAPTS